MNPALGQRAEGFPWHVVAWKRQASTRRLSILPKKPCEREGS